MNNGRKKDRLKPINYFEVYDEQTRTYVGNLVDMSTSGLRLLSENPISPGDIFDLKIRLPRKIRGSLAITVFAECRWCNECASHLLRGTFGVGLQIHNLQPETRDQIKAFIKSSYFHDWRQLPDYAAADVATTYSN